MNFLKKIFNKQTIVKSTLTITSASGFHLRPIAKFANEAKKFNCDISITAYDEEVSATQVPKIISLSLEKGENFTLKCVGSDANEASSHLTTFFKELMENDKEVERLVQTDENYEAPTLNGVSVVPGIAIAPLVYCKTVESINSEVSLSIKESIELTKKELETLYNENQSNSEADIYLAHKELLSSDIFQQNFQNIDSLKETINKEIERLKGTKFESRIADYKDIQQQILTHIGITTTLKLPDAPYILLVDDLLPSDVPKLVDSPIQGVVLKQGTPTSHASILLRSFAIPTVIIHDSIEETTEAILDTSSGNLVIAPTKLDREKAQSKLKAFQDKSAQNYKNRFESTQTLRGKSIKVLANIGDVASAKEAKELGADGIGLLRSEFLFMEKKPSLEEQTNAYREIFELFDELTIRTLDVGGDKPLPYAHIAREQNPFLGIRGIRFSLLERSLLEEQLLAIFKAVEVTDTRNKTMKIMFPMVNNCDEFIEAKKIAIDIAHKNNLDISAIEFGIMLEVPSVIFALHEFDQLVDFYSIGTNDLTQYLFAIERTHPTLQADALSPMVMNALKMIIETSKKPVSICGELAGLAAATERLVNLGYDTLSVSAKLIPSLKERIRNV
jgi:phosphocarrier protein FPr